MCGVHVEADDLERTTSLDARGWIVARTQKGVSDWSTVRIFGDEHGDLIVGNRCSHIVNRERAGEIATQLRLRMRRTIRLGEKASAERRQLFGIGNRAASNRKRARRSGRHR